LIKKVHIERKANFEWIGESGLDDFVISINENREIYSIDEED
jgi:hypothetical protein